MNLDRLQKVQYAMNTLMECVKNDPFENYGLDVLCLQKLISNALDSVCLVEVTEGQANTMYHYAEKLQEQLLTIAHQMGE